MNTEKPYIPEVNDYVIWKNDLDFVFQDHFQDYVAKILKNNVICLMLLYYNLFRIMIYVIFMSFYIL